METDSLPDILKRRVHEIEALCRKHHVTYLAVFGSATTDHFRTDSDLDFLVTLSRPLIPARQ